MLKLIFKQKQFFFLLIYSLNVSPQICDPPWQVAYQNDPEGALIQFASPDEAKRAIQSTEAVLNNRFIKLYWYREDGAEAQGQSHSLQQQQQQLTTVQIKKKTSNMAFKKKYKKSILIYKFVVIYSATKRVFDLSGCILIYILCICHCYCDWDSLNKLTGNKDICDITKSLK